MSIATEITRLQNSKTSLKASIQNKGVTVPSTTKLDGYAALVDLIQTNPTLQNKTVTPTESSQSITADSGYDGLNTVTVNAISSTYVGSGITRRSGSDLSATGATVSVPAGYYSSTTSKSVATATQASPTASINTSTGVVTASCTQSTGYVTGGTKTGTLSLTTQSAKTITPTKSSQTAVASGRYTTGTITVAAIPSQYITTTDATAAATDITSGKTAYVNGSKLTGTLTVQNFHVVSSKPSTVVNGDLYLLV